jgi:hypothetical protein
LALAALESLHLRGTLDAQATAESPPVLVILSTLPVVVLAAL